MGSVVPLSFPLAHSEAATDAALVAACGKGDAAALGQLFKRHNRCVYRFLARMAPLDHSHLDDLVQNTFLSAYGSAHRYKDKSSVRTWLLAIASNILKNHIRAETRRRRAVLRIKASPPSDGQSPEKTAEEQRMMARLTEALDGMSHKLRVVFVLCDLEGIPGVEVARMLKLREGTVWRRLHEARKLLRCKLSDDRGMP